MATTPERQQSPPRERPREPVAPGPEPAEPPREAVVPPREPAAPPREPAPRIVEEHVVTDAAGEQRVEAVDDRGRRWFAVRPQSPGRYDVLGFGAAWWIVLWVIIIGLIIWGWGWGWGW